MFIEPRQGNGEDFNLRDILLKGRNVRLQERVALFSDYCDELVRGNRSFYMRRVMTPSAREVDIIDPVTNRRKSMLMFGSNNYLGLANHPVVRQKVIDAVDKFGVGIGGPPLLNGTTSLHRKLEERLSAFKHKEDTVLFASGYAANVGLVSALLNRNDIVLYDEFSHASFSDGLRLANAKSVFFRHNDVAKLAELLEKYGTPSDHDTFVGVEGVYSMDGDLAPLDRIVGLCKRHGAILMVDDAHGTGVLGNTGSGTAEHFGVEDQVDVLMGTFSKTFGVVGGFVCASRPMVNYLRFFARSHMFSAALPPPVVAAVLAGLDVIESEPERISRLHENVRYAIGKLRALGLSVNTESAIIALSVPPWMNLREAAFAFHQAGIFVNAIEYPAVPVDKQRFRISVIADHTKDDIDRLAGCVETIWSARSPKAEPVSILAA
jgi:glycine C-acetyltransferase